MSQRIDGFWIAEKVNNYIVDATDNAAGNAKFDSTTVATMTVPAGKRWFVIGGLTNRDASATIVVRAMTRADKPLILFQSKSAATGTNSWPNSDTAGATPQLSMPLPLDEGEYVQFTFGAAQSTAAYLTCVVLEVDI